MWCLKGREGICVYIMPNQKKSFGKSLSNVKLEGDPTISRLHAVVTVESIDESDILRYKCVISDLSKYGTFVIRDGQKTKLLADEKFTLKAGDTVQFGLKQTTFVVSHYSFVIVKSSLDEKNTERLTSMARLLAGKLSETWENSCTHLTVPESILFTTKVACALASAKPIVTIAYWEALQLAVEESKELPDIENFLPTIKEKWLKACSRLLLPNEKRRTLFKGLSFVHFCAKQYFTYSSLITTAGGKSCVYPTKRPLTPRDLTAKNAIVIQQPADDSLQFSQVIATDYPIIYRKLQAIKRRMISDTEIPLAILYCSTEMYCNTRFEFATFLKRNTQTYSPSDVIMIEDTQNIKAVTAGNERNVEGNIVPETCVSQKIENVSRDVRLFDENARRDISDTDKSDVVTKTTQNADERKVRRGVIPETCGSQENDLKRGSVKDTLKEIHYDNGSNERRNVISGASKTNIVDNIFSRKVERQLEIIPESCCSLGEKKDGENGGVAGKSDRKRARDFVFEISELDDKDPAARKTRRNVESQRKREGVSTAETGNDGGLMEKNALIPVAVNDQQRENYLFSEKDNSRYTENSWSRDKNRDDSSWNGDYGKSDEANGWQSSKGLKRPRIVSIEELNDSEINIEWKTRKAEDRTEVKKSGSKVGVKESKSSEEQRKLNAASNRSAGGYQEDAIMNENGIRDADGKKEEAGKTGANRHKGYLNPELTDGILRKDAARGKKFTKVPVVVPKRILKMDDFVLMTV